MATLSVGPVPPLRAAVVPCIERACAVCFMFLCEVCRACVACAFLACGIEALGGLFGC